MTTLAKKIVKTAAKFGVLTVASITALVASANASNAAETFRVNGDFALNTNQNFRKVDTMPRMSQYTHNINDPDQQFERLPGMSGAVLLKHRSTSEFYGKPMCLNAHYLTNGSEMNVWACNASDPDQNFNLVNLGNNYWQIKRSGTNSCVDAPERRDAGKIHMWTCDSNNANQRWLSQTVPIGYRSTVESVLRTFFGNTANTNGENWSAKTIAQMWDRVGGESAQFPTNLFTSGDKWQVDMPAEIYNVYKDLSTQVFGTVQPVTTGYAYDYGYYASYGSHSALDMDHGDYANVKAAVRGKVVKIVNDGSNGYWVAVDEVNTSNQKMGRRWWYGHLTNVKVTVGNIITPGTIVAQLHSINNFPEHLHLTVFPTYSDTVSYSEAANSKTGNYSNDVQTVLNRTMSPLEAYWRSRNNLNQ